MHRKRARGILGILKKSVELILAVWRRRVTFASSQWPCGGCHTCCGGAHGKASIERLCLSPYAEKPFNSKVIKSFVSELRSRVFRVSGFRCSMDICYEHSMFISHIRIMGMLHLLYSLFSAQIFFGDFCLGLIVRSFDWTLKCNNFSCMCFLSFLMNLFLICMFYFFHMWINRQFIGRPCYFYSWFNIGIWIETLGWLSCG